MDLFQWGHGTIGPVGVESVGASPRTAGPSWPPGVKCYGRTCVGGRRSPVLCSGHLGPARYQVTKQPEVSVANCLYTKANAAVGGAPEWCREMERAQPSLQRSLFFSPGHTCGCQAVEDSKTDNGYLMSGFMQIQPEYASSVPSGFAFKRAVNGAGRLV